MAKVLYLNQKSNTDRVGRLLAQVKSGTAVLVIPKKAKHFQNSDDFEELVAELRKHKSIRILVATADRQVRKFAEAAGISVIRGKRFEESGSGSALALGEKVRGATQTVRKGFGRGLRAAAGILPGSKVWRRGILAGIAGVVLIAFLVFLILPQATISLAARTEPVTRDIDLKVDSKATQSDVGAGVVPGRLISDEVIGTKAFTPSGSKNIGDTASGFIQIYNFSKTTLILKAQTTVLTANGHSYRFVQDVGSIRPTAFIGVQDQEVDESSLIAPVPIIAASPGTEYNLKKGTRVEINNEVFGSKPDILYGVVAEDIGNGTDRLVKIVTEADLASSFTKLSQELVDGARTKLFAQNKDLKLLNEAIRTQVVEQSSAVKAGAQVDQFESSMKMKINALAYDEKEVSRVIAERIKRLLPQNKKLVENGSGKLQVRFSTVNLETGQGILTTHFEGTVVFDIDAGRFTDKVKGKSGDQIREILMSQPEVRSVDVKFSPAWVKKAPMFSRKISIKISP